MFITLTEVLVADFRAASDANLRLSVRLTLDSDVVVAPPLTWTPCVVRRLLAGMCFTTFDSIQRCTIDTLKTHCRHPPANIQHTCM